MKEEVSSGIILFNDIEDRKFLLLNYPSKTLGFCQRQDGRRRNTS